MAQLKTLCSVEQLSAVDPVIEGDDASSPQAQIMLEGVAEAVDLPGACGASQLVAELIALRKPSRTERMPF